jgi:2,3-bisphosphoglycerate-independent phosphoglycerate mutase
LAINPEGATASRPEGVTRLLFLFLDGVGLGSDDPRVNPFVAASTPFLDELLGGKLTHALPSQRSGPLVYQPIDATLGHPGLPQSATGQTALLTGLNGADIMNGHYGPWPGPTLKAVLDEGTLFTRALHAGKSVGFANAFPPGYFSALEQGQRRVNVPVYAAQRAGIPLMTLADYRAGRAISADLTGAYLNSLEPSSPLFTPDDAGRQLARVAQAHHLTFFDFWLSDTAGHRWSFGAAVDLVEMLDAFLAGLVSTLDGTTLLVTSDHGNLEDKEVRGHTAYPVPLLAVGPRAASFLTTASLMDVPDAVLDALGL